MKFDYHHFILKIKGFIKKRITTLSLSSLILAPLIAWFIQHSLDKLQAEIQIQELKKLGGKYVYLVSIKNIGKLPITNENISVFMNGNVLSSVFDGRVTTRYRVGKLSSIDKLNKNNKNITICEEDIFIPNIYPFTNNKDCDDDKKLNQSENILSKNNSLQTTRKGEWYNLNLNAFNLNSGETILASLFINQKLTLQDFKCTSGITNCIFNEIESIPSTQFDRIFEVISISNDVFSNYIYGTGTGIAKGFIKSQSIIKSRNNALADLYKNLTQKLYGITVSSEYKGFHEYVSNDGQKSDSSYYKTEVSLKTKGILDKNAISIYSEESQNIRDGYILYKLRGAYRLPWKIQSNINFDIDTLKPIRDIHPIELEGEPPKWIYQSIESGNALYSVGVAPKDARYPIARMIASNNAIAVMSSNIQAKVDSRLRDYIQETKEDKSESIMYHAFIGKVVSSLILTDIRTIAYYKSKEGYVYALVTIPRKTLKQAITNYLKQTTNNAFFQDSKYKKAFEEFQKELEKLEF